MVPLSRANNVSIMLTQFSQFKQGSDIAQGIRRAVVTGKGLTLERLSLLLQVGCLMVFTPAFLSSGAAAHTISAVLQMAFALYSGSAVVCMTWWQSFMPYNTTHSFATALLHR